MIKSQDTKIILELSTKLNMLVRAREIISGNVMSSISITFEKCNDQVNFSRDQVIQFDIIEDVFLGSIDQRIADVKATLQKILNTTV